jgi:predicted PurR-regulated permease PerM
MPTPSSHAAFSTASIFKLLAILFLLWFLWYIHDILILLFVSLLLAALIEPPVNWLHRYKIPRALGVLGIYVILFAVVSIALLLMIPPLVEQVQRLILNFSDIVQGVTAAVNRVYRFGASLGLGKDVASGLEALRQSAGSIVGNIFTTVTNVIGGLFSVILVLVLTFYMVVEEDSWRRFFRRMAPDEYQPYLTQLFMKMQKKIGQWLRGQLIVMFAVGAASYLGLLAFGIDYALVLGLFAGLVEIVPYAGPTIGAIPALLIAFLDSPLKAVFILLLYLLIQQLENSVLTPKVMQKTTGLNPLVSIVALLIGFKVAGIAGAIFAIPVATMLSVFAYDVFRPSSALPAEKEP